MCIKMELKASWLQIVYKMSSYTKKTFSTSGYFYNLQNKENNFVAAAK